jgi:hypothetical protein
MLYKNLYSYFKRFQYLIVLISFFFAGIVLLQACKSNEEGQTSTADGLDRTVLQIKEPT